MSVYQYELMLNENNIPYLKVMNEFLSTCQTFNTVEKIVGFMNDNFDMGRKAEEYAYILCFNTKMSLLGVFELSHGTSNASMVGIREIMIRALTSGANAMILMHNHPSGDVTPSKEDLKVEKELKKVCEFMKIDFLDSIIIGKNKFRSFFKQEGIL